MVVMERMISMDLANQAAGKNKKNFFKFFSLIFYFLPVYLEENF